MCFEKTWLLATFFLYLEPDATASRSAASLNSKLVTVSCILVSDPTPTFPRREAREL